MHHPPQVLHAQDVRTGRMILAVLGLGAIGIWFVVAGDGPGRLVGAMLIALAVMFGVLFWIAVAVERPGTGMLMPQKHEVRIG